MDKKIVIQSKKAPKAIGTYSQGIICDNLIFTSGQIPIDPKTNEVVLVIDDIVDRGGTAQALRMYMPNMHLAVLYAKPRGLPLADTYVQEISQETWPVFPWDEEDKANH